MLDLESRAGRSLPGIRVFDLWDQPFPSSDDLWLRDNGHTLFFSVRAKRMNGSVVLRRDIANAAPGSTLYQEIVGWATKGKSFGEHMYFTFNHEPEASASDANGTPQEFIAAWRKVIDVFRQQNVTNATYVFITTGFAYRVTDGRRADLWYPGDAYVDAIGEDDYNWSDCRPGVDTPWRSLEYIADPLRVWAQGHPGKELMVGEPRGSCGREPEGELDHRRAGVVQATRLGAVHRDAVLPPVLEADVQLLVGLEHELDERLVGHGERSVLRALRSGRHRGAFASRHAGRGKRFTAHDRSDVDGRNRRSRIDPDVPCVP